MVYAVERFTSFESSLEAIWRPFEATAMCSGFQGYDWLARWQAVVGTQSGPAQPNIFVIRKNDSVIGIFPLVIRTVGNVRVLEWLGGLQSDFHGPLLAPDSDLFSRHSFLEVWSRILSTVNPVDCLRLQRLQPLISGKPNPFVHFLDSQPHDDNFVLTINSDWDTYLASQFGGRSRRTMRRKRRKLEALGALEFKVLTEAEDHIAPMNALFGMKHQRANRTGISDLFKDSRVREFYRMAGPVGPRTQTHLSQITVGDRMIAVHWGLIHDRTFYFILPTFDVDFSRFSPGQILIEHLIKWCLENGIETMDFTIGPEAYKSDWCNFRYDLHEHRQALTWLGSAYLRGADAPDYLKKIRALRQTVRGYRRHKATVSRTVNSVLNAQPG